MNYKELFKYWSENEYFNEDIRQELLALSDIKEIEDRFYKYLDFGTGGLRGVINAGTNRMNIYTVRKATQGFSDYVNDSEFPNGISGVAIAYDCRRMSKEFAMEAACVLAANGIVTYLFKELMPTPILSFAVRRLHCSAGIVITASHNPKEYNGYKVYGMDGGQITDALADKISACIRKVEPLGNIKVMGFDEAVSKDLVRFVDSGVIDTYVNNVLSLSGPISKNIRDDLKIVYSPLHGTGLKPVKRVLKDAGFRNVYIVEQQSAPDTEFSTVASPNPEDHAALKMAIDLAEKKEADIVIATDPDCDRLGVAVRNAQGGFEYLNGNQIGCILLENLLRSRPHPGKQKDYIVKTIVTTKMADAIAKHYEVRVINVLTGFKYIGEMIKAMENGPGDFIFGFEESNGYLAGTFVRDKDAVIAALLICEAAASCKHNGQTLIDVLDEIYLRYGYYLESLKSYEFIGKDGAGKMDSFMKRLRESTVSEICGYKVLEVNDYLVQGESEDPVSLPKSDVLLYELENEAWIAFRPSGTEPKLKIYIGVKGASSSDSRYKIQALTKETEKLAGLLTV